MRLMVILGVLGGAVLASAMILHADLVRVALGLVVGATLEADARTG